MGEPAQHQQGDLKNENGSKECCERLYLLHRDDLKKFIFPAPSDSDFTNRCDPLGYDLGLSEIHFIKRGKIESFRDKNEVDIFPGETLVIRTSESLRLPKDVFAMGSPKMKLLIRGLWGHGGKTEPGYNDKLILGFHHIGNEKITLKKDDRIFHLTFFRIVRENYIERKGEAPPWQDPRASPLDVENPLCPSNLEKIKEYEGIGVYRLCKLLHLEQRKNNFLLGLLEGSVFIFGLMFLSLLISAILVLWQFSKIDLVLAGALAILKGLISLYGAVGGIIMLALSYFFKDSFLDFCREGKKLLPYFGNGKDKVDGA